MQNIFEYIQPEIIEKIREEISLADGNEVFFVGKTNPELIVEDVEVIARGNQFAVPLVEEAAVRSDVVIHNHPSGELAPSTNDLAIAYQLAKSGIASYIVNNTADKIYVVIKTFQKEKTTKLDADQLCHMLAPDGVVSKKLSNYEHRPQQIEMIRHVVHAFNENKIAVVEAGTGVGKSLAYLIPAIYCSTQNKKRCVVSTRTINLQEQLIKKDIPFLRKALGIEFRAVLVKGRGNYVCLRKIQMLEQSQQLLLDDRYLQEIQTLVDWSKTSSDGSKSDLNFVPQEAVWEQVASESDTCQRSGCEFFQQCFVNKARRIASQANILVANHHLLFSDLALRSLGVETAVLPSYQNIVFDEAHNIEDIATDYFGDGITRAGITRILRRLYYRTEKGATGYLSFLAKGLTIFNYKQHDEKIKKIIEQIEYALIPQTESVINLNNSLMDTIAKFVTESVNNKQNEVSVRINAVLKKQVFWKSDLIPQMLNFVKLLNRYGSSLSGLLDDLDDLNVKLSKEILSAKIDIDSRRKRLKAVAVVIKDIFLEEDENHVRWIEVNKRYSSGHIIRARIAPLNISEQMNDLVYEQFNTIIMTSATLAIAESKAANEFLYFSKQVGINLVEPNRLITKIIPASFDYQKQAITAIPTDIPAPDSPNFADAISDFIYKALQISDGRAFILFTSYGLLNKIYNALAPKLTQQGITTFKQGQMQRHELLQNFKTDKTSVLFATDSFWQGVDVEGDALESVIITKLPFKVPSEPIVEARVEAIEKQGGNGFMEFSLPQAVLKLKQGFGRLIRKKTDRGSVFILDKRIIEKFYGKIFLNSLPKSKVVAGKVVDVLIEVQNFFDNK